MVLLATIAAAPDRVLAADPVFGEPTASATWGTGVTFRQPVTLSEPVSRAEILLSVPGSLGPVVSEVQPPTCCGGATLEYQLHDAASHIVPNTRFTARWRLTTPSGAVVGPPVSVTYLDTRFDWKTKPGKLVRVHWYQGSDAFGRRALEIGERAVEDAAKLLGVSETEPVDFYIYAGQQPFYDALGPGTRENVGGEAHADIRTMFALITPDEIDASWVGVVVPHELTHLVFDTAVKNAYHFPPRWLNEGLAVYLSEGYTDSWRSGVRAAIGSKSIIPLDGLTGQFPTTRDRFFLAYGESVSAVDYLVRTFGKPALVKLVRSYADGVTDDEAFTRALGIDATAFGAKWLGDLGVEPPVAVGPAPPPAGPLPSGWTGSAAVPSGGPVSSARPVATPAVGSPASPIEESSGDGSSLLLVVAAFAVVAVVAVVLVAVRRRGASA